MSPDEAASYGGMRSQRRHLEWGEQIGHGPAVAALGGVVGLAGPGGDGDGEFFAIGCMTAGAVGPAAFEGLVDPGFEDGWA